MKEIYTIDKSACIKETNEYKMLEDRSEQFVNGWRRRRWWQEGESRKSVGRNKILLTFFFFWVQKSSLLEGWKREGEGIKKSERLVLVLNPL